MDHLHLGELSSALAHAASHMQRGDLGAATDACMAILREEPRSVFALHLMGIIALRKGCVHDALLHLRQAMTLDLSNHEIRNSVGAALATIGEHDEAVAQFVEAVRLRPSYGQAHVNLAASLRTVGRLRDAEASARRALQVEPGNPAAQTTLGAIFQRRGAITLAIRAFRQAKRQGADPAEMSKNCALALGDAGRARSAVRCLRRAVRLRPGDPALHSALLYALHYDPVMSPAALTAEHESWSLRHAEPLRVLWRSHENDRTPGRRLRIGYLSADLRANSVARFVESFIRGHDRRAFAVTCYSDVQRPDSVTRRIQSQCELWRDVRGTSDERVAELIRQDRVDVLVDPTGHMGGNRMLTFARRPAPVQVVFPGYPGTTGLQAMDGFVTDRFQNPPNDEDCATYSERLLRLDAGARTFFVDEEGPPPGPLPALRRGYVTFGSLNRPVKITENVVRLWCQLLHELPSARLLLFVGSGAEAAVARLRRLFGRAGVSTDRLEFVGHVSQQDYLRLFHRVDIHLDTFPYNGCTTTCDALWMAVPTVSLAGKTYVSRVGLSILSQVGLSHLAASSPEGYIATAMRLADNLDLLSHMRQTLRQTARDSSLFDGRAVTRCFEQAIRQLWVEWCAKQR